MHNVILVAMCYCLLTACGMEKVVNYILEDHSSSPSPLLRDTETDEVIKMWVPKNGMIPNATWESLARGAENMCSNGYYIGKNISDALLSSERSIYKVLPKYGNKIWAYYYYYGEDSPLATGGTMTTWYETVFNIYADAKGRIYGCYWQKYPRGWHFKNGTTDGRIVEQMFR